MPENKVLTKTVWLFLLYLISLDLIFDLFFFYKPERLRFHKININVYIINVNKVLGKSYHRRSK